MHDLLLRLGDLSVAEIEARSVPGVAAAAIDELVARRRALPVKVAGEARLIAVEDAARYRDGLGTPLPAGLPASLLEPAPDAVVDLVRRYARTHGPFTADEVAARLGLGAAVVAATLQQLAQAGRVVEGEFRPGGQGREWCDADVLRVVRSRSLAALRKEVEPVEPHVLGRFLVSWHGLIRPRAGLDALLDVVERLQGAPLVASVLEREVLAARVERLHAGAARHAGVGRARSRGWASSRWVSATAASRCTSRISCALLAPPASTDGLLDREARILAWLIKSGASFFGPLHDAAGGGFPQETVDALWSLVWKGLVTNDTLHPLRAYTAGPQRSQARGAGAAFPVAPPGAGVGRGPLVGRVRHRARRIDGVGGGAHAAAADAPRRGGPRRDGAGAGAGRLQRHLSGAAPAGGHRPRAARLLRGGPRAARSSPSRAPSICCGRSAIPGPRPVAVTLAATDPANPYGALVEWPAWGGSSQKASRVAGARVVLVDGLCDRVDRPRGSRRAGRRARRGSRIARGAAWPWRARWFAWRICPTAERRGWLVAELNGEPATASPLARYFVEAGFAVTSGGLQLRVPRLAGSREPEAGSASRCLKATPSRARRRPCTGALAGRVVTAFATGLAPLARVDDDTPIAGRTIEHCRSVGKHC